jgi:hypothetical protein
MGVKMVFQMDCQRAFRLGKKKATDSGLVKDAS